MNTQNSIQEQLNKLTEFRQKVYRLAFTLRRDTQFELLDALVSKGRMPSFPWLSTAGCFRRAWPSVYDAVEQGQQDTTWLASYLARQVPACGIQYYALDATGWARQQGRTLPGRQYIYQPGKNLNGKPVAAGYAYSLLDWVPEPRQSWSLSVDVARVPGAGTDLELGVQQVKALCQARADLTTVLDVIVGDCKYSSPTFLAEVQDQPCGIVARMRKNRVLYHAPEPKPGKPPGRPRKHGRRFAFKEPETWGEPEEFIQLEHPYWGQVELRRWHQLHGKGAAAISFDIVQARVHLERSKPPNPLWLMWLPPPVIPAGIEVTAESVWLGYDHRWPIEPNIRFRKQQLMWTSPQFHTPEAGDRWSILVSLAVWTLYLARPIAQDCPLPWQPRQIKLTPSRVRQAIHDIFAQIGTPAGSPQTRGNSPGWPKGKPRERRQPQPVIKKQAKTPKSAAISA
jgi:hypothetical protein